MKLLEDVMVFIVNMVFMCDGSVVNSDSHKTMCCCSTVYVRIVLLSNDAETKGHPIFPGFREEAWSPRRICVVKARTGAASGHPADGNAMIRAWGTPQSVASPMARQVSGALAAGEIDLVQFRT